MHETRSFPGVVKEPDRLLATHPTSEFQILDVAVGECRVELECKQVQADVACLREGPRWFNVSLRPRPRI